MELPNQPPERRKHIRINKNFHLFYYLDNNSENKTDVTTITNIGRGGIRFTTSREIAEGSHIFFEISIPYIAPKKLILDGHVLFCKKVPTGSIYEIRAKFEDLDDRSRELFNVIEQHNLKDSKHHGLS